MNLKNIVIFAEKIWLETKKAVYLHRIKYMHI